MKSVEDQLLEVVLDVKVEGVNDQSRQLLNVSIEGTDISNCWLPQQFSSQSLLTVSVLVTVVLITT